MNAEYYPIVVLKPSTSECGDKGIYSIPRNLFVPTAENVRTLITELNDLSVGIGKREKDILPYSVEHYAVDYDCNILGGAFLAFLASYSVPIASVIGSASIQPTDVEFMTTLYPDLQPFFEDPTTVDAVQQNFARGVVYNNTGNFKVVKVEDEVSILNKLVILKKSFRRTARVSIAFDKSVVRDNLVHCPDSEQMLTRHMDLLRARFLTK